MKLLTDHIKSLSFWGKIKYYLFIKIPIHITTKLMIYVFNLTRFILRVSLKIHWKVCSDMGGDDYYEHIKEEADEMLRKVYKK